MAYLLVFSNGGVARLCTCKTCERERIDRRVIRRHGTPAEVASLDDPKVRRWMRKRPLLPAVLSEVEQVAQESQDEV